MSRGTAEGRIWRFLQRILDPEVRQHAWLMSDTINVYIKLFRDLQRVGIDTLVEIAPGRTSLPAIANAMLRNPLGYCAYETDPTSCAALRLFCDGLGLTHQILNVAYHQAMLGKESACLVFEHSIEDMFLESRRHASLCPNFILSRRTPVNPSGSTLSDDMRAFVSNVLKDTSTSRNGAAAFHHFKPPFASPSIRDVLDLEVVRSLERPHAFDMSAGWSPKTIAFVPRMAYETWSVYQRRTHGS